MKIKFKRKLYIEFWDTIEFEEYFTLPELIYKGNGKYGKVDGLFNPNIKNEDNACVIVVVINERTYTTLIHELTHYKDANKWMWLYNKLLKPLKRIRRLDPYEIHAWKNEKKFCRGLK